MTTIDAHLIVKQLVISSDRWEAFLREEWLISTKDEVLVESLGRISEEVDMMEMECELGAQHLREDPLMFEGIQSQVVRCEYALLDSILKNSSCKN